jgi:hypothetical protein
MGVYGSPAAEQALHGAVRFRAPLQQNIITMSTGADLASTTAPLHERGYAGCSAVLRCGALEQTASTLA